MRASDTGTQRVGLVALLLLSVFAWAPALYPGYWQGLEGFVPVFNAAAPGPVAALATTPDLWRGAGSAAFLLTQPLIALGVDATAAVRLTFIFAFILGGVGVYAWLRPRLGDAGASLAGLVYMLAPLFLSTVYVRGSLADALVLGLLPAALAGLAAFAPRRSVAGAALALLAIFWLWRVQAGLALLATPLLLVYVLTVERSWWGAIVVGVGAAAGLVTLLPYWGQTAAATVPFYDHFVDLYQLLAVAAPGAAGWQGRLPLQPGFAIIGFGVLAVWGWWTTAPHALPSDLRRLLWFALAGALLLVLLATALSAPLWQGTGAERLLTYPWQMLLLALPLLATLAGALPTLLPDLKAHPAWIVLMALTVLAAYPYLTADYTTLTPPARPVAIFGRNQLALLETQLVAQDDPAVAQLEVTWQPLAPLDFDYNVFFQAVTGDGADERVVSQLDVQPLAGAQPATAWRPGQILSDSYTLDLSAAPAGAPLKFYFGYYDWRDGQRLPVDGGLDDKLVLYGE